MPTRHVRRIIVCLILLFVVPAGLPAAPAFSAPDDAVSPFLEPLRKHAAAIEAACAPIERLAGWTLPDRKGLPAHGRRLLETTHAFRQTAEAFVRSPTRRGLREELDIVSRGCRRLSEAGRILRQVSGVQLPPAELTNWDEALGTSMKLAHTWLMAEVTQDLIAQGPMALLETRSFEDIQNKAWARMGQKLDGFKSHLDRKVRTFDRYFAPLELLEAEGVAGFVRVKAREKVHELATALVVDLSGHGLLVRIAGDVIYRLAIEILWPKLREVFRQKGNLEPRVKRSLETLEESRLELNTLGSDGDSVDVPLSDVCKVVARARGRLRAMHFLVKDLKRANRNDLSEKLAAGATNLRRSVHLTGKRFLLDKIEEIETLAPRVALLGPLERGIQRLLAALDKPDPLAGRSYFVYHDNMPLAQKLRPGTAERPARTGSPSLFAYLYEVDHARRKKMLDRHLAMGRDAAAFDETSNGHARAPRAVHLLMARCEGQTRFRYSHVDPPFTAVTYGKGWACGLADGPHQVQLTVTSADGLQLYFEYTILVQKKGRALSAAARVGKAEQGHQRMLERYHAAADPAARQKAARTLASSELALAKIKHQAGVAPPQYLTRLLDSALAHQMEGLPNGGKWPSFWSGLFLTCEKIGDADAYHLYAKAWERRAPSLSEDPRQRAKETIEHETTLARLAIGGLGDIELARKHFEKAMRAKELGQYQTQRPDWKKRWRARWPRPIVGVPSEGTGSTER